MNPVINFAWNNKAPVAGVEKTDFSIRWTGQIQPLFSETYTIKPSLNAGRLWVNGQLLYERKFEQRTVAPPIPITFFKEKLT